MNRLNLLAFCLISSMASAQVRIPDGNLVIRAPVGESEIVITTTSRLAGAIHSVTWNGKEFIDSFDHGRQLQSASNFDAGTPIKAETFNPTEAGSLNDGAGPNSTSRLLHTVATKNSLQTTSQMAFWLAPDQDSAGNPAKNETRLSNHLLTKRVTIGYRDLPNVVQYDVTFSVPIGEKHTQAVFEAVTGYMPAEFERFWKYDPQSKSIEPLSDGPGEQRYPVVFATKNGSHAMGIYSPQPRREGFSPIGYGRFRFTQQQVVKWNCVFRLTDRAGGIAAGDYHLRNFVIIGELSTVRDALEKLHAEFEK